MSYFGVSTRNGVGLGLGTVPSLTNTPLGYRLAPSLDLSFAGSDALSPAITFSRTTNATLTNSAGLVANAPHNLLTHSEQFDNAAWLKSQSGAGSIPVVTANTSAAPDGTLTADTVVFVAPASGDQSVLNRTPATSAGTYTGSFYVKATSAGDVGKIIAFRNVSAGSYTLIAITASWQRVTSTETRLGDNFEINLRPALGTSSGTVSVQLWGAQLELGTTATTYNPTTVKNLLGYTEHFDNAAWTKSNSFVQTNLILQSETFNTASWVKGNVSVTPNATTDPNGANTASLLIENTVSFVHGVYQGVSANGTYTFSIYAKAHTRNFLALIPNGNGTPIIYDLVNGVITQEDGISVASITPVGNGWYRCSGVRTFTSATAYIYACTMNAPTSFNGVYTGDGTSGIYIWGAQLVQGTSAGDYKATYASAAAVGYPDIYGQPFAQKLVENTVNSEHYTQQTATVSASAPYTASVYMKAGERTLARVLFFQAGTPFTSAAFVNVDLAAGTVNTTVGTATISSVGNGWYCVSATGTTPATNMACRVNTQSGPGVNSYQGDGTSGIYIFGAQLSDSASVDPYVYQPVAAPVSTAYYGPRFDYDASTAVYTDVLGPELVNSGVGVLGSAYAIRCSSTPTGNGFYNIVGNDALYAAVATPDTFLQFGKAYEVTLEIQSISGTTLSLHLSTGQNGGLTPAPFISKSSTGVYTSILVPGASNQDCITAICGTNGQSVTFKVSIKEILATTSTGATPKGLLIEEQRTNLLTYSEDFSNAAWVKINTAITANAVVAPDGTLTGDKVASNTATVASHQAYQIGISITNAAAYTWSVYMKQGEYAWGIVNAYSATDSRTYFNLATGTVGTVAAGSTATITPVGNGWYRCSVTRTSAAATGGLSIEMTNADNVPSFAAAVGSGIYIWGAQLEAGAFATSYIPTVASQVTRAADTASMIGNNFARWYQQDEGTLFGESQILQGAPNNRLYFVGDGTVNNYLTVGLSVSGKVGSIFTNAVDQTDSFPTVSATSGVYYKQALAYANNDAASSRDGLPVNTDNLVKLPIVNFMGLGFLVTGANLGSGTIKRVAYYNRRLSNTELQGLTS